MPDKPRADLTIDEPLIRALVSARAGDIRGAALLPLSHADDGWDCSVWRLGEHLAVRLPRRAAAAPLILHEQRALGEFGGLISATGVGVPAPIVHGQPDHDFPWPWSIVPWFDGVPGYRVQRSQRSDWATPLARALSALHAPAPADHPINEYRGVPFAARADSVADRLDALRPGIDPSALRTLSDLWQDALGAEPWSGAPVWIHGDLHPGNLIARGSHLVAIIDFGDVTAGDPAYDLAVAWLAFDAKGRTEFVDAYRRRSLDADAGLWIRARGWAAAVTLILLHQSDDNPSYARLGMDALAELISE